MHLCSLTYANRVHKKIILDLFFFFFASEKMNSSPVGKEVPSKEFLLRLLFLLL